MRDQEGTKEGPGKDQVGKRGNREMETKSLLCIHETENRNTGSLSLSLPRSLARSLSRARVLSLSASVSLAPSLFLSLARSLSVLESPFLVFSRVCGLELGVRVRV